MSGESGTGSLTIQPTGGSTPSSTVDIPTVVLEYGAFAPNLTGLGAIVFIAAIMLIGVAVSRRRSTA